MIDPNITAWRNLEGSGFGASVVEVRREDKWEVYETVDPDAAAKELREAGIQQEATVAQQ